MVHDLTFVVLVYNGKLLPTPVLQEIRVSLTEDRSFRIDVHRVVISFFPGIPVNLNVGYFEGVA